MNLMQKEIPSLKRKTIVSHLGAMVPCFAWTIGVILLISALLHLGGDFQDIYSYAQPRLGAAVLSCSSFPLGFFPFSVKTI